MTEINNLLITDSNHICAILSRLKKSNCSLEIKNHSASRETSTLGISEILSIDLKKNKLLFDAINKATITAGQKIKLFTKHHGVEIIFNTTVTGITEQNYSNYFTAAIPAEITHKQRRQQYRAELQNLWKIPVTIIDESSDNPLSAYIYNISTGGINVRSSTANFNKIKKDAIIKTLIQLPDDSNVNCKLLVRKTQENAAAGFQQLAGQFIYLNAKQEKTIQSFVNTVERNNIKNRAQLHAL